MPSSLLDVSIEMDKIPRRCRNPPTHYVREETRDTCHHISPTWNKCVIGFYYNYGVNFNWSTKIAAWDPEHLSEMKFKVMNHPESKSMTIQKLKYFLIQNPSLNYTVGFPAGHICCRSKEASHLCSLSIQINILKQVSFSDTLVKGSWYIHGLSCVPWK